MKWKYNLHYRPFVPGINRSPMNSPHKGQWRGALVFSLICAWINGWVNNGEAGDLRRHRVHYDVIVMPCHVVNSLQTKWRSHSRLLKVTGILTSNELQSLDLYERNKGSSPGNCHQVKKPFKNLKWRNRNVHEKEKEGRIKMKGQRPKERQGGYVLPSKCAFTGTAIYSHICTES